MLSTKDLFTLEQYKTVRESYKKVLIPYRKSRQFKLGTNMTLHFENSQTIKYQILEMLYAENHTSTEDIQDELNAYNPLIPNGSNLKATLTIEYSETMVRHEKLKELLGVEHGIYIKVNDLEPIYAIADEDLERSTNTKTSAVHFLRFEFTQNQIEKMKESDSIVKMGVTHKFYNVESVIDKELKESLRADFHKKP